MLLPEQKPLGVFSAKKIGTCFNRHHKENMVCVCTC